MSRKNASASEGKINIMILVKAVVISYVFVIPIFMFFSFLLSRSSFSEMYILPVVFITTAVSVMLAGFLATVRTNNKGLINGALAGIIYMILLFCVSSVINKTTSIDTNTIIMIVCGVIGGAAGGAIGVNFKRNTSRINASIS